MNNVTFQAEGVEKPEIRYDVLSNWIKAVADSYGKVVGSINYIFLNDEGIIRVNREFLQHDYYTDIITFDYSRRRSISGDIYISLDTVRFNADQLGCDYADELYRVIIHGVLHLCGINDKGPGEREIMEVNEDKALTLLRQNFREGYCKVL